MAETDGGKTFRDILAAGTPIVFDGGMGTSLYEQVCDFLIFPIDTAIREID